jgi:hypothetical protein
MDRPRLSVRRLLLVGVIVLISVVAVVVYIEVQPSQPDTSLTTTHTTAFDFDTGSPPLAATQGTPFNQTLNGLTASFSSPSDSNAFSVKDYDIESLQLSKFSGKYLYDNKPSRDILDIKFSDDIIDVRFTFATIENKSEAITVPSNILITGYRNTNLVGSNQTVGSFSSDSYPQGTLYFYAGIPFNWIRISIPSQTSETTDFLVDNIIVTTVSKLSTP